MPVRDIRPGMTGYGLTVFQGTRPERFAVRVVGVLRNFMPQMDIILIRSDDPRLLHVGVAAGMSGSPIYVEDRLVGALAYGWAYSKDPIAGVTPIENMLAEIRRPQRGRDTIPMADAGALPPSGLAGRGAAPAPADATGPQLVRAAVPLSVSGMTEGAVEGLRELLAPYRITPVQAGGSASAGTRGPERFEPGSAIAVQLVRGDISATATGTVTYLEGSRLAAFGHPMFNAGEVYFPMATAEVVHILSSLSSSFKMSTALETKGALLQDRQAGIIGDVTARGTMIPLTVTVRTAGRPGHTAPAERTYRTEIASHRVLTPLLTASVVGSALQATVPDITDAVVHIRSRLAVKGFAPLEQSDAAFSPDGVSPKMVLGSAGVRQLQELISNGFAPVRIENLELTAAVDYRPDVAEIAALSLASDELEPDTRPSLSVTLRAYGGALSVRSIPIDIPRALAGQTIKIEASAGHQARVETAPPESLADLVENLRKGYSARSLVVTVTTADEGVALRGRIVPGLPASVLATLRPGSSTRRAEVQKRILRQVVDAGCVISGKQELSVLVKDTAR